MCALALFLTFTRANFGNTSPDSIERKLFSCNGRNTVSVAETPDRLEELRAEYERLLPKLRSCRGALASSLADVLRPLAPRLSIQSRVKSWESIEFKLSGFTRPIASITDLNDLIGMRCVLLFGSDVEAATRVIEDTFTVVAQADAGRRLEEDRFGYLSKHIMIQVPDRTDLVAEVQVRTMAQHVWAEASHTLQYKQEDQIPDRLHRSIYSLAAVMELVDRELERIRELKSRLMEDPGVWEPQDEDQLATLSIQLILYDMIDDREMPEEDDWFALLTELLHLDVKTIGELKNLIREMKDSALRVEQEDLAELLASPETPDHVKDRYRRRGKYLTPVGLVRTMLLEKYPDRYAVFDGGVFVDEQRIEPDAS